MRTTIDISDEIFRKLKTAAAMSGTSLKRYVHKAIERELARDLDPIVAEQKIPFPFLHAPVPTKLTGADLARLLDNIPKPDAEYFEILEEIIRNQPPLTPPPQ